MRRLTAEMGETMAKVTLRKTRETRVRGGHPWIYASEIEGVEGEFENGITVTVFETVEKEVTKDQPSRLHARRQMKQVLYPVTEVPAEGKGRKKATKRIDLTDKIFDEYAPKYANRAGGYTRMIKIGPRKGDAAMMVVLEMV